MRSLNLAERLDPKRVRTGPARPEMRIFDVRGKRLGLDANTLAAWELAPGEEPEGEAAAPQFRAMSLRGFRTIVLEVTHACNLECSYCFVRNYNPDRGGRTMPLETAVRAVGLIPFDPRSRRNPPLSIGFFGGEPLVAFARVKEIVAYVEELARQRGIETSFSLTTNGTLLDDEKIAFLGAHRFSLIVSLEGPAAVHDRYRPMAGGGGSHAAVLAAVKRLKDRRGISHVTLRSTFTGEEVDLRQRLEYLNILCDEGCADHVSVEPVSLSESGCIALPDGHEQSITLEKAQALRGEYSLAAEWFRDRIKGGRRARFHHFYKMLERVAYRLPAPSECGAGCGYAAVAPAGEIYACHREGASLIGHVESGIDEAARAKWVDNRHYAREGCGECWARWACGGGCRLDSLDRGLGIRQPDPVGCFFKRVFCEEALWLLSELTPEEVRRATGRDRNRRKGAACAAPATIVRT